MHLHMRQASDLLESHSLKGIFVASHILLEIPIVFVKCSIELSIEKQVITNKM